MKKEKWVPDRGDIIWIDFNPQSGREMKDMHPMLILSPKNFNKRTSLVIGLPMTTANYNESNPFAIKLFGPNNKISYILTHQPKSFDWVKRNAKPHPWKHVSEDIMSSCGYLLNQIITLVK